MTKTTVEMLDLYARVRMIEQAGQAKPGKLMVAAGASILTCKLKCIVCSAARYGKRMFIDVARTGPLCQMLPRESARRHHG